VENSNSVEPRQNISPSNMASCDNYLDKHRLGINGDPGRYPGGN
jgi:hypothetical protein